MLNQVLPNHLWYVLHDWVLRWLDDIFLHLDRKYLELSGNYIWFAVQAKLCIQCTINWWIAELLWFVSACIHKIDVPNPFLDALHLMSLKCSSGFNLVNLILIICRPSGTLARTAGCYIKNSGFESRVVKKRRS